MVVLENSQINWPLLDMNYLHLCFRRCIRFPCLGSLWVWHGGEGFFRASSNCVFHYSGVIMNAMASEITSLTIVYSTVFQAQMNVSIWWRHRAFTWYLFLCLNVLSWNSLYLQRILCISIYRLKHSASMQDLCMNNRYKIMWFGAG